MPKTQTTSPTTARLQCHLPRWSALWAQQCSRPRPHRHQSGGIARHEGSTRRRHAARRLRVVQNPHHHRHGEHQGYGGPGHSACERQKPGNRTQGRCHFRYKTLPAHLPSPHIRYKTLPAHPFSPHGGTKLSQHEPHGPTSGTKLSQHEPHGPTSGTKLSVLTRNGSIWRFFYMQGEFYTVLTTKKPSRENFVPFSPPRSQAGRVMYRSHHQEAKQGELCTVLTSKRPSRANCVPNARQRSSEPTQQHSWPHRCEARRRGRSTSPRCRWAAARPQPNKFRT